MTLRIHLLVVLLAIVCSFFASCGNSTIPADIRNAPKTVGTRYTTIEILEYGDVPGELVDAKYGVDAPLEEPILRETCEHLVAKFIAIRPRRYIKIMFYLHESDLSQPFQGGWAEWGVDGERAASLDGTLGDYSRHRFTIEPGVIFQDKDVVSRLDVETRRSIHWEIVSAEDEYGLAGRDIVAQKRGLTEDEAIQISVEGSLKSWPMPPNPELRMNDEEFKAHAGKKREFTNQYYENKRMREADSSINNKNASNPSPHSLGERESRPAAKTENKKSNTPAEEVEETENINPMFDEIKLTLDGRLNDKQRAKLKKISREYAGSLAADLADLAAC